MIRSVFVVLAIASLSGCNYNPRVGGWKLMLQKQPSELPPRYYIPRVEPGGPHGGVMQDDRGRRIIHDSTLGPVPAPGLAHIPARS